MDKMPLRIGVTVAKPDQIIVVEGRLAQVFKDTPARSLPAVAARNGFSAVTYIR